MRENGYYNRHCADNSGDNGFFINFGDYIFFKFKFFSVKIPGNISSVLFHFKFLYEYLNIKFHLN